MKKGVVFTLILVWAMIQTSIGQSGTATDANGNTYKTVRIGNQLWTAENLRTTKGSDGTQIATLNLGTTSQSPGMYWYDNDPNSANSKKYGPLYNWAAISKCNVCPDGWRVASQDEWNLVLRNWYNDPKAGGAGASGLTYAGYQLREAGDIWPNNGKATNSTGFSARPGGWVWNGKYYALGEGTAWWTQKNNQPVFVKIWNGNGGIWSGAASTNDIMYVRCMKNCTGTDCDNPDDKKYVVEMLGRRGVLTLSDAVDKNPKGVKISLYGTDGQTQKEINLDGCYWNNGKLAYSGKLNLLGKERQIYLSLKPEGDNLLGKITENNVFDPIYPIYATKYEKAKDRLPAKPNTAKQYDLVVVNVLQTFSGPWWSNIPVTQVDSKFKMVYVTYDSEKHTMSLYDVPNDSPSSDFDVSKHIVGNESVHRYITPEIASSDESVFAEGLLQMIYSLRMKYPGKKFAIKYTGHGAPYMSFERISYGAQNGFFPILAEVLGTKIEYLDWSTNCNASSLYNLKIQAPYANYIMANDLLWGGCFFEGMKGSEYPWKKYNEYMTKSGDTKANLKNYVAALKAWLNNPAKQECYAKGGDKYETPQQITLFDCRAVETLLNDPSLELDKLETADAQSKLSPATYYKDGSWTYGDLKTYITNRNVSMISLFNNAIVEQANNRSSFTWKIPAQGINFAKK